MRRRLPCLALVALLAVLGLGACGKKHNSITAPQPGSGGTIAGDVCSGTGDYTLAGFHWALPTPSYFYATSLPSEWRPAVDAGAATWNQASPSLSIVKQTTVVVADVAKDGKNVICYGSLPTNVLGTTYSWYSTSTGVLAEADIKLSSTTAMTVGGSRTTVDVQSVITHEFGHFVGLDHVNDVTQTMYPSVPPNSQIYRTLCEGDIAGVRSLYP